MPTLHNRSRWLRLWVFGLAWVLSLVLVLTQSLAQWHAVKHPGHQALAGGSQAASMHAANDHGGFLDKLFASHSSDKDCRLYDQLGDGHAMPTVAAVALPVVMPSLLVAIFAGQALARWAALFDARGPPLTF